jgi:hypothetical protein
MFKYMGTPSVTGACRFPSSIEDFITRGKIMAKNPHVTLVSAPPPLVNPPLRQLAKDGRALWDAVVAEFDISDSGGRELLQQAAEALDRVPSLRVAIERDGVIVETTNGPKVTRVYAPSWLGGPSSRGP